MTIKNDCWKRRNTSEIYTQFVSSVLFIGSFHRIAMVTNLPPRADLKAMRSQVIELCQFSPDYRFTLKWIDEEQDPCVISSDMELDEAIRLLHLNKECQLTVLGNFFC